MLQKTSLIVFVKEEVAAPEHYGRVPVFGCYYLLDKLSFLDADGGIIQQFQIYNRLYDQDLDEYLIYDVTHDRWYKIIAADNYLQNLDEVSGIGNWERETD